MTAAHRFNDLQRFLGILQNFEWYYSAVIRLAKDNEVPNREAWYRVNPDRVGMWSCTGKPPVAQFQAYMGRLGVEVAKKTFNIPGPSKRVDLGRLHQYWHVRNSWAHGYGIMSSKLRSKVDSLVKDDWFDEVSDDRAWVLGCLRSRDNWEQAAGPWQEYPLEQVLAHVNALARWIAKECEKENTALLGHIK